MQIKDTTIAGLKEIKLDYHEDSRGRYYETFNAKWHGVEFVQDDISISRQWTLRGFHGDTYTTKLVSCAFGNMCIVVVDPRPQSETYGLGYGLHIKNDPGTQLLVPPGCAVAHLVTSPEAVFMYKQSSTYAPGSQFTIRWDDARFGVPWPLPEGQQPILSERDANA